MAVFITSLNSGSNGNCYYIGNETEAILIDAGISCREIERRMKSLGLLMTKVKAVFISHEHTDHIKGLTVLAKRHQLPVYITAPTMQQGFLRIDQHLVNTFSAHHPIAIGELIIKAFPKHHDACDPYSFTISCNNIYVGVFTDIGKPCTHLISHFKTCNAAFLETNYDDEMLDKGGYPYHLKNRIRGGKGHLSNKQALELFINYRPSHMSHLFLSHLSKHNNSPELVQELFDKHANGVQMIIAPRNAATPVYCLDNIVSKIKTRAVQQMEFSFI
jgi:phosphoribosyl 1,2-cyclic phosphodiesterase